MKGTTDSQIPECSHSFSLPSEPPDIRNWYPSYTYESFVLDTYDGFGGSQFREGETERCGSALDGGIEKEKEGVSADSERNDHINEESEAQTCNKMLDSLYSASLLSEPPHIKNWFSSYEYQSPMSDEEDLKVSATQDSDCDKNKPPIDRRQNRKEETFKELSNSGRRNEGECAELLPIRLLLKNSLGEVDYKNPCCKIPDSSDLSALSGPPDVGNWFSSYVYKSPELDENSELAIGETEYEEDQFSNQRTKKEKEMEFQKLEQCKSAEKEITDLKVPSDDTLENECMEKRGVDKENFSQDIVCWQREHCLDDKSANHDTYLTESIEISRLNDERPEIEQQPTQNFPGKPGFVSLETGVKLSSGGFESPSKSIYQQNENVESNRGNESAFISSRNNAQLIQVAAASTGQGTCEFNNKENGKQESLRDGFVTTKKSRMERSNNESSFNRQSEILLSCSKNRRTSLEGDQGMNGAVRRKVLSERTNFGQTAAAMEVTGKWKCPQKRKPIIGPPLKQLRLEQWVRRQQ